MTRELAERLYVWVGQALRSSLVARFQVDEEALDRALNAAVSEAQGGGQPPPPAAPSEEELFDRAEMEQRLIAKLHDAGQLKPSYLLRTLRDGKLSLFEAALSKLGGFSIEQVRQAIASDRPELLALACSSVGVDRSVFPTILSLVRGLSGGNPMGPPEAARRALGAFGAYPPTAAATAFRHAVATV